MPDHEKKKSPDDLEVWWEDGEPEQSATLFAGPYKPRKKIEVKENEDPAPAPVLPEKIQEPIEAKKVERPEAASTPQPTPPLKQNPEPIVDQTVRPKAVPEVRPAPVEKPVVKERPKPQPTPVVVEEPPPPSAKTHWPTLRDALRAGECPVDPPTDSVGVLVIRSSPQKVRRGQVISVREARTIIGRGHKVHVLLDDPKVGEYHAVINHEQRSGVYCFTLYPLSGREVQVNGNIVRPAACLRTGDRIRIGSSELVFFQVGLTAEHA